MGQLKKFFRIFISGIIIVPILLALIYFLFSDCSSSIGRLNCTQVLFIGNSYTSVNDLPGTFAKLAFAGGHKVVVEMSAPGGWTLAQHAASQTTIDLINSSDWDYVVIQEQSQIPSNAAVRSQSMIPAVKYFVPLIRQNKSEPILFITWAHQNGWPEMGMTDYESMQSQIIEGYLSIAKEEKVAVAPVGYAWLMEHRQNPQLPLWASDGIHPDPNGTYLAACVFYATIFKKSPVGLLYFGGLPANIAKELQIQAEQAVQISEQW